jgi:hypothetical protein
MKYRVISVEKKRVPIIQDSTIIHNSYLATYEVDSWSWRKFKVVSTVKQAFKRPHQVIFRDAETGEWVPTTVDTLIEAFIDLQDFKNDHTRSNLV